MGTLHANGKARSNGVPPLPQELIDGAEYIRVRFAGGIGELKTQLERLERLEFEKSVDASTITSARAEAARLYGEKTKLEETLESMRKVDAEKAKARESNDQTRAEASAMRMVRTGAKLRLAAIEQKHAWAEGVIEDVEKMVSFAGLSSEHALGSAALVLLKEVDLLRKRCDAQLAANEYSDAAAAE